MSELINREQVAKLLGIHFQTVWSLVKTGKLRAYKVGGSLRFRREDLSVFLEANAVKPKLTEPSNN